MGGEKIALKDLLQRSMEMETGFQRNACGFEGDVIRARVTSFVSGRIRRKVGPTFVPFVLATSCGNLLTLGIVSV